MYLLKHDMMDSNHTAGTLFGAIIAMYKSIIIMMSPLGFISWELLLDTFILAFIGGALGWCGAEVMKFLRPIIKKFFSKLFKNGKKD